MNNKLIVFLFPAIDFTKISEESLQEYVDPSLKISDIFDTLIEKRYLNNEYDFMIATYPDRPIYGLTITSNKIVYSKAKYDDFYKRPLEAIIDDYKYMALQLNLERYSEIVVGGYHLGDCVDKFANAIENYSNAKVSIDGELTSHFMRFGFLGSNGNYNKNYEFYDSILKRKQRRISFETVSEDYANIKSIKENSDNLMSSTKLVTDELDLPPQKLSGIHR